MSTKKDGYHTSVAKKVPTNSSRKISKKRDGSVEKKEDTPMEDKIKKSALKSVNRSSVNNRQSLKEKTVSSNRKVPAINKYPVEVSSKSRPKLDITGTQSSSRVSKSMFFPSKNMYANALKTKNVTSSTPRSVQKSELKAVVSEKTLKKNVTKQPQKIEKTSHAETPNRQKMKQVVKKTTMPKRASETILDDVSPDTSTISERPRTATLKRGSIANLHLVGPDAPNKVPCKNDLKSPKSDTSGEDMYDDDFESYESDFEAYSSSSSNLDNISGEETSSISSSEASAPKELKTAVRIVNSAGTDDERKMDSGNFDMSDYKHKRMLDNINESIERENANLNRDIQRNNPASLSDEGFEDQKSLQFINFLDAKKKSEHRKSMETKRKRGEELLNMIKLDTYSFTLFDQPSVPYEEFIKSYGKGNTIQSSTQTGEDNVCEEIQTEDINCKTKWTQNPVSFTKTDIEDPHYWQVYKNDYLGVGGEEITETNYLRKSYNEIALEKFLLTAGELVSKILKEGNVEHNTVTQKNTRDIPFSKGYTQYKIENDLLKYALITNVYFCCDNDRFMSVHTRGDSLQQSAIAVWNVYTSDEPEHIFVSYGKISCCAFNTHNDLVYAGHCDGTISIWTTKKTYINDGLTVDHTPLYSTDIAFGHRLRIVAIHSIKNSDEENIFVSSTQIANEICTLDEEGELMLWSVIMKQDSIITDTSNCSILLAKNSHISLKLVHSEMADMICTDFIINANNNEVFISTNYGIIIHHLIKGGRSNVRTFQPGYESIANCLDTCSFSPDYFIAGFENGNINLYSSLVAKPLMVMSDKEVSSYKCSIQLIQWSKNKPFIIYAKDIDNNIHVWNLNESDIFPVFTVPFEKTITCMTLSPHFSNSENLKSYMVIGTDNGELYLHLLSDEHGLQPKDIYQKDVETFCDYVHRL